MIANKWVYSYTSGIVNAAFSSTFRLLQQLFAFQHLCSISEIFLSDPDFSETKNAKMRIHTWP